MIRRRIVVNYANKKCIHENTHPGKKGLALAISIAVGIGYYSQRASIAERLMAVLSQTRWA